MSKANQETTPQPLTSPMRQRIEAAVRWGNGVALARELAALPARVHIPRRLIVGTWAGYAMAVAGTWNRQALQEAADKLDHPPKLETEEIGEVLRADDASVEADGAATAGDHPLNAAEVLGWSVGRRWAADGSRNYYTTRGDLQNLIEDAIEYYQGVAPDAILPNEVRREARWFELRDTDGEAQIRYLTHAAQMIVGAHIDALDKKRHFPALDVMKQVCPILAVPFLAPQMLAGPPRPRAQLRKLLQTRTWPPPRKSRAAAAALDLYAFTCSLLSPWTAVRRAPLDRKGDPFARLPKELPLCWDYPNKSVTLCYDSPKNPFHRKGVLHAAFWLKGAPLFLLTPYIRPFNVYPTESHFGAKFIAAELEDGRPVVYAFECPFKGTVKAAVNDRRHYSLNSDPQGCRAAALCGLQALYGRKEAMA